MIASERKLYILRCLGEAGVINLKEVAQALDISETTVRRDFEKLESEGRLTRVQGGAVRSASVDEMLDSAQSSMSGKRNLNKDEKEQVARKAAELVNDGDSVFLDCGTSLAPLGEILMKRRVQIVTNSTLLLARGNMAASLFLVGGQYRPNNNLVLGPLTKQMLAGFHFDHAFIGCFGVSIEENKAYTLEVDTAEIKLAGMASADKCHLLADRTKFLRKGFFGFADISRFDTVICGRAAAGRLPANVLALER